MSDDDEFNAPDRNNNLTLPETFFQYLCDLRPFYLSFLPSRIELLAL